MTTPTVGNGAFGPVAGQPDPSAQQPTSSFTRQQFAEEVLRRGGWPVTQSNIQFLLNWMQREGGSAAFNPINTTHTAAGATDYNSVGVKNYTTLDQGVDATVATIGGSFYKNIRAGLAAGQASEWDKAGRFSSDLHAWSAGPNAPMSKGYTTVSNVDGSGSATVSGDAQQSAAQAGGSQGLSLADFALSMGLPPSVINDPTIHNLIQDYENGTISYDKYNAGLHQTDWWKNTPQSTRQLMVDQAADPATAQQTLEQTQASIDQQAWKLGVKLTPQSEYDLALGAIKNGWTSDQLTQQIVSSNQTTYSAGGSYGGQAATTVQDLKAMYNEYALPVSDQTLNEQVQLVLAGKSTVQDLQQGVAQKAKSLYGANPDMARALDSGQTVNQYMSTYADYASNLLGVNRDSINWLDPKWQKALTGTTDPTTGQTTGMSLAQWGQTLRTDPIYGYDNSQDAINTASQFANQLVGKLTGAAI